MSEDALGKAIDAAKGIKADAEKEAQQTDAEGVEGAPAQEARAVVLPASFQNHPGAIALNNATDAIFGLPSGSSAKAEWGESWCSLLAYYSAVPGHPALFVLGSGMTLVMLYLASRKKTPEQKLVDRRKEAPGEMVPTPTPKAGGMLP